MSSNPQLEDTLRSAIIAKPDAVLEDQDVMSALVAANERAMGGNIVDLRGIAMELLEARLDRLEDTHRSVIAAAYDNLSGTNQVHRAILRLMEATDFENFLRDLGGDVAEILRVDEMTLVLESAQDSTDPSVGRLGDVLNVAEPGFIDTYLAQGRGGQPKPVMLRPVPKTDASLYGDAADRINSEACLKLDLGAGRLPGLLAMGAEAQDRFSPQHGTDLLVFFAGVFERSMRHWLS
jgi:uncharacterized protein YigA (DUF484 family)